MAPRVQPDLNWYTEISAGKNLAPRCPFASVHRCPRYYQSVSLLGEAGITTQIEASEGNRLLNQWKRTDLWPVVNEQATSISGPTDEPRHFSKFCPEVSFDRFKWFASHLSYYSDEIDQDVANSNLAAEGVSGSDWQWIWALVVPMHYADCPLYSPLLSGVSDIAGRNPTGFYPSP
jgi:hypothetical protein